ncbi:single-stranded-DNA-specific exonuclease RecJ [Methylocaldum szegediense]|uniref:Single-stranded-DNA-specific exonuclease RecJ n=1 Tax=Methylocaldum szegediense TaxID=73780 RepID=A0ABN8X2K7_9GAMM|nr:single-stranded-DNA-specific exonuclease RecJ [Methylocaldum szegediense]CAI8836222.1 ssDNA-specific exonuclease RecJ [Methylocaldum szegediense]
MPYYPVKKKIIPRASDRLAAPELSHLPPLLQRIYTARRLTAIDELDRSLARLPSPWLLSGMEAMADQLAEAIRKNQRILVIADYDTDGATACAVAVRGLKLLGAERVSYLVPNRFEYGYGLTPEIVVLAAQSNPDILLTVDNGISSLEGTLAAKARGIRVLITDHHLPGSQLPEADGIVNPNLAGDPFPSKCLAGVGVMFYVLSAVRNRLRTAGHFARAGAKEPNLAQLLDLVALGTVADVVCLDHVNRILVHQGLQRIRSGQAQAGLLALLEVAGRDARLITAADLGFAVAPRLNAAGRLEDMTLGIECLLTDDADAASAMAVRLDQLNRDRREIEEQMKLDALAYLEDLDASLTTKAALCLFDDAWHQGVVGILASRIKDRLNRPVIAFARTDGDEIKGSARSIPGVHIRDVLSDIATRNPNLLRKFGGHAIAAGLSLHRNDLARFAELFEEEVARHSADLDLDHVVHSDGPLEVHEMELETAELLRQAGPWGQGFPEPLFDGEFDVAQSRIVGDRHLKLLLRIPNSEKLVDGIAFFVDEPAEWLACRRLRAVYRLEINEFRDVRNVQLRMEYMESRD